MLQTIVVKQKKLILPRFSSINSKEKKTNKTESSKDLQMNKMKECKF